MYEDLIALANRLRQGFILRFPFLVPRKRDGIYAYLLTIALMGLALFVRLAIAPVSAGVQYVPFFHPSHFPRSLADTSPGCWPRSSD